MQIMQIIIPLIVIFFFMVFSALIEEKVKYKHRIRLAIVGIILICSLPFIWAYWMGGIISFDPMKGLTFLFIQEMVVVWIGVLIIGFCYSWFLANGLVFLNIGLVETIEQLVLSQFYPSLSFSMLKWSTWLAMGISFMLLAIPERLFRGKIGISS